MRKSTGAYLVRNECMNINKLQTLIVKGNINTCLMNYG